MIDKKYICMKCLHKIEQQDNKNLEYSKEIEQCCQCGKKTNYWYEEEKPLIVKVGL